VPEGSLSRRSLLGRSALGGGAAVAAASGMAGARAIAAEAPAAPAPPAGFRLFAAPDMNFEALFALGETAYGAGEAGEILATVNAINAAGASYQAFYDGFTNAARTVAKVAADARAAGYLASARSAHLRSAQYYDQALFFVLGTRTPQAEESVYQLMQQQWDAATRLFDPPFEPVRIPYENTTMPGYFLAAKQGGRRPTVIVMNGSDAQNVDVYAFGGAAAIERGWNALIFEGPGQGSMLFERKILAWFQLRLGPIWCGPWGLMQPAADAVKLVLKEDLTPGDADPVLYHFAPAIAVLTSVLAYAAIPFGTFPHGRSSPLAAARSIILSPTRQPHIPHPLRYRGKGWRGVELIRRARGVVYGSRFLPAWGNAGAIRFACGDG